MINPRVLILACAFLALLVAMTGCGHGRQDSQPPTRNVARLICEEDGTTALTKLVEAGREGIDIQLENRAVASEFYIFTTADPGQNHGGHLKRGGVTDITTTMPPGDVLIGCSNEPKAFPTMKKPLDSRS
jgi:hypothetical protein